jgi:hypothetical protein
MEPKDKVIKLPAVELAEVKHQVAVLSDEITELSRILNQLLKFLRNRK